MTIMSDHSILIVEDERALREMLCFVIEEAGYSVLEARDTYEADQILEQQKPSLILLDWMLPGMSGVQYARKLRRNEETLMIPLVMLTARSEETDMVAGLEAGADDYITKPFSNRELLARMKALLRRHERRMDTDVLEIGELSLDSSSYMVMADKSPLKIGPTEFKLLKFFMTHPGRVYSRSQLLDQVWGHHVAVEERTVDVHVLRLRKALAPVECKEYIQTVRGAGYRFQVPAA